MRPSVAHNAASSGTLGQRLLEKKKEFNAVNALYLNTLVMLENIEQLAAEGDAIVDGSEVVGKILANWPNMFSIFGSFANQKTDAATAPVDETVPAEAPDTIPRLVRVEMASLPRQHKSNDTPRS